jgi:hypothetical protein
LRQIDEYFIRSFIDEKKLGPGSKELEGCFLDHGNTKKDKQNKGL